MSKITVIHHSADFDGLFCREIARKFMPDAEMIGWDFGDAPVPLHGLPADTRIYILDLPVDRVFGFDFSKSPNQPFFEPRKRDIVWIDHHKSSIESHPKDIPGFRIDGVAACRLAWNWFAGGHSANGEKYPLALKVEFVERTVLPQEPLAVRLAGEYDIWDKHDPNADVFQFGLRSKELTQWDWKQLLDPTVDKTLEGTGMESTNSELISSHLLKNGALLMRYQRENDANLMNYRSFPVKFEGLTFLCLNTPRCNSLTFIAKDVPETGHDGLMAFYFTGIDWKVSLYHAKHRTDIDLSQIAVKYGGGGHRGACGFAMATLPFLHEQPV